MKIAKLAGALALLAGTVSTEPFKGLGVCPRCVNGGTLANPGTIEWIGGADGAFIWFR